VKKLLYLAMFFLPFFAEASEITMRIMPSPQTPEADFAAEGTGGWDAGVGYGRIWLKDSSSAFLNGVVAGVLYRGVLGRRIGYTLAPLVGGMYFGNIEGFKADSYSVGTGFSLGSRIFGRYDSSNIILFAGGLYSFGMNRDDNVFGTYSLDAHFFGFSAGLKSQLVITRKISITPFYVYLGGGGSFSSSLDTMLPVESSGSLGYHDTHLLGLDFNIYGVSAKVVADLFRKDAGSFTIWVEIGKTIRGISGLIR